MRNIRLLDCTLRDGARIIDGKFTDYEIGAIAKRLTDANIDFVEMGFIRDPKNVTYKGDSIFFTDPTQIEKFIPERKQNAVYLAFIDYGMYNFDLLPPNNGKSVNGLRVGFTKKDYLNHWDDVVRCFNIVKEKGYKLLIQGVNSLNYTDSEFISLLGKVNDIKPYAFGIVDTYGAMCLDDVQRLYSLVDHNLDPDISIDIHTHNNCQMAFALVQEVIGLCRGNRILIIDATLEGVGKCAGNLNLELIAEFLNTKRQYNYDFDLILDTIDEFLFRVKQECSWGYSIPAFMGSIYMSHPNNIIFLTSKFRLTNKDIKNIISMIDVDKRQRYDYDNIEKLYLQYSASCVDDSSIIDELAIEIADSPVLVIAPGNSLHKYRNKVVDYINRVKPYVISVNFQYDSKVDCVFFGNKKRYDFYRDSITCKNVVVSSNIKASKQDRIVNYNSIIDRRYKYFDNSTIMLLNLLRRIKVKKIILAGFDGYSKELKNNYFDPTFSNDRHIDEFDNYNSEIGIMLGNYIKEVSDTTIVRLLTPSYYVEKVDGDFYE